MSDEQQHEPQEFEGVDLDGAVFWGVTLRGALFRDVDLTGARVFHAQLTDVDIDGIVERLVVNGVDVTDYVNAHDAWYPLRTMLRPADAIGMLAAWDELDRRWVATCERAFALGEAALHDSVNGEWSFRDTLRLRQVAGPATARRDAVHALRPAEHGVGGARLARPRSPRRAERR
jgi:hypothetical protein